VNPLEIASGFSEFLNLFGGDCVPIAVAEVLPDATFKIINSIYVGSHVWKFRAIA
jgi:hypothetical protein